MWGLDEMCMIFGINLFMIFEKNVLKVLFLKYVIMKKSKYFL